jgi:hypothetical protein
MARTATHLQDRGIDLGVAEVAEIGGMAIIGQIRGGMETKSTETAVSIFPTKGIVLIAPVRWADTDYVKLG